MNARFVLTIAAASLAACGSGDERRSAHDSAGSSSDTQVSGRSASAVAATTTVPEGCDLIVRAEIERIAGPLQGEPKGEGNGCWYYVAMDTTSPEWKQLREGAERARTAGMDERAIELYHPTRAGIYVEVDVRGEGQAQGPDGERSKTTGWDEASASPSGAVFHGRTGHVRVAVRLQ